MAPPLLRGAIALALSAALTPEHGIHPAAGRIWKDRDRFIEIEPLLISDHDVDRPKSVPAIVDEYRCRAIAGAGFAKQDKSLSLNEVPHVLRLHLLQVDGAKEQCEYAYLVLRPHFPAKRATIRQNSFTPSDIEDAVVIFRGPHRLLRPVGNREFGLHDDCHFSSWSSHQQKMIIEVCRAADVSRVESKQSGGVNE